MGGEVCRPRTERKLKSLGRALGPLLAVHGAKKSI